MKILRAISVTEFNTLRDLKPTIILIGSALILTIHRYFGSMDFIKKINPAVSDIYASNYLFLSTFILLGLLPFVIIIFVFRENPTEYGLNLRNFRAGITSVLILFPIIALVLLLPSSQTAEMKQFYPLDKITLTSPILFIRHELFRGLFYYTAWEFFFRGFILFGLRKHVSDWLAICIQVIPSCLWHIGMPFGEIIASIPGGILFGIIAIRTESIVYPFLLHFLIGAALDLFIIVI